MKHGRVHLPWWQQVYLSPYLARAWVVGGVPKSHGESGARDALREIKGRNKAASQLANCKASKLVLYQSPGMSHSDGG